MAWFDNEQASASTVIIAVFVLGSVLYGYSLCFMNPLEKLSGSPSDLQVNSPNPTQLAQESIISLALSPEARKAARAEYIKLVQSSLIDKFRDVDTHFTTKSLLDSVQQRAKQQAEILQDRYVSQLERLYKAQNPQPLLYITPPPVDVSQSLQVAPEDFPWLFCSQPRALCRREIRARQRQHAATFTSGRQT